MGNKSKRDDFKGFAIKLQRICIPGEDSNLHHSINIGVIPFKHFPTTGYTGIEPVSFARQAKILATELIP
jgi:hypothetical protein